MLGLCCECICCVVSAWAGAFVGVLAISTYPSFGLSFCTRHLCCVFRCDLDAEGVTQAATAAAVAMETTPANNNNLANQEEMKLLARLEAANR